MKRQSTLSAVSPRWALFLLLGMVFIGAFGGQPLCAQVLYGSLTANVVDPSKMTKVTDHARVDRRGRLLRPEQAPATFRTLGFVWR